MNVRFGIARALATTSAWALRHVFRRPAANFPGKIGLYADPQIIEDLRGRLRKGSVVIVGTNGKTTVTNLIADALLESGISVACNRTGANLDSGVATAMLESAETDWGVFECDELWLCHVTPALKPAYVVLLNLFRDQLDRMGEIALIQDRIAEALTSSPRTVLVYNCDDPLCQTIAERIENACIPFGIGEDLGLAQNTIADTDLCQRCDGQLSYSWRQYGQLGNYSCPKCGFVRPEPNYSARAVQAKPNAGPAPATSLRLRAHGIDNHMLLDVPSSGTYMIYNVLAAFTAADLCNVSFAAFERAVSCFDPHNGRLQRYRIGGTDVLLNLAKNPTGFNQNLNIIAADTGPKAVAFFINDKEADGHDVSWLWDVDFEELSDTSTNASPVRKLAAYAGGTRRHDMQVRLKHANIQAELVESARDFLERAQVDVRKATCYLIANYTALPAVKAELDRMACSEGIEGSSGHSPIVKAKRPGLDARETPVTMNEPPAFSVAETAGLASRQNAHLVIAHLYPKLLNLYGDSGNVAILANRARWRGIAVDVVPVNAGQKLVLDNVDIVFLGGGPDREQARASQELVAHADVLREYVEDDGVLLAICGGYQILGRKWVMGDQEVPGLGILDATTKRAAGNARNRLVGNIALQSPLAALPVIGYENHAGRTFLGESCTPFGTVIARHGHGNDDTSGADGALYRNAVGTYLHGPLLAKNPEVADWLIERALARRAAKQGHPAPNLAPLDDACERAANAHMRSKLGIR